MSTADTANKFGTMRIAAAVAAGVVLLVALVLGHMMFTDVDAGTIVVIQKAFSGELVVETNPGMVYSGFGTVTVYPRRAQYSFSAKSDQGGKEDQSMKTQFNDGGTGRISGTVSWQMPLDPVNILKLHKDYRSVEAIDQMLIRPAMQKVIFNVGPTMSSTESSAERRPDITKYMDDQLENGPYLTKTVQVMQKDPITGQDKQASVLQIAMDEKTGLPLRESKSQIAVYGIQLQPVAIEALKYDDKVEKQIEQRQEATTQVQISIANARKAEQDAITIAKQGEATAAKAKWEQETVNAKEIAVAEKDKQVAELNANRDLQVAQLGAQTAAQVKQKLILEGEGEAQKRALILNADGALDKKLEAYVQVNSKFAEAIKDAQPGAWTPYIVGSRGGDGNGTGAGGSNNATNLIDLLTAKTAKELGLDRTVTQGAKAKQ